MQAVDLCTYAPGYRPAQVTYAPSGSAPQARVFKENLHTIAKTNVLEIYKYGAGSTALCELDPTTPLFTPSGNHPVRYIPIPKYVGCPNPVFMTSMKVKKCHLTRCKSNPTGRQTIKMCAGSNVLCELRRITLLLTPPECMKSLQKHFWKPQQNDLKGVYKCISRLMHLCTGRIACISQPIDLCTYAPAEWPA